MLDRNDGELRYAEADCCLTPVLSVGEGLESAHCKARGLVRRGAAGDLQALFPARVDGVPPATRAAPKALDEAWRVS